MSRLRSHRGFDTGLLREENLRARRIPKRSTVERPLASAEHERHRVQDASAVGRSLMKRVLEADPQQASKGIG
jgi:hypothetical protein